MQCQYQYADTGQHDAPTDRSPDDHRNHPHDPMTTPDKTTTPETTRQTTETTRPTDRQTTADASPRSIPGRTPITEEAGAPIVPATRTSTTGATATDAPRRPSPPPTDAERDAPLVPDLRPTRTSRTDGGSP